jgi:3-deoxy-D-manno-octulosonic-acid transferase
MRLLYITSIYLYYIVIWIAHFFSQKANSFIKGRTNQWKSIGEINHTEKTIWFHCASLGEFDQGIPVMNELKRKFPKSKIVVTFFSPSGMEHYHKRIHCADYIYYLPIDTPLNARKFLNKINPTEIFFIKYEFWLNYIFEAKKRNIPIYSVSCILRPTQIYFKFYGSYFKKGLQAFSLFFVQNEETKNLLNSINIYCVSVTGDTRFDKVIENKKLVQQDLIIEKFLNNKKAFILGSSWQLEEQLFHEFYTSQHATLKVIIAPHDISENHLTSIEKLFQNQTIRYSQFSNQKEKNILLIDCIGKLANSYSYGEIALVGGGFTGKLHNTLEPVVFGLPVIFGPKHSKFPEAKIFMEKGIGFEINNSNDLKDAIEQINKNMYQLKTICSNTITNSAGAAHKIIEVIYN